MMDFDHRKFLNKPKFSQKFASDCYLCYVCPENCYLSPPPPQYSSPPPPPQFSDDPIFSNNSTKNQIPTILILMLCVLGLAFLVLSYLTLARYRRRSTPPPLEPSRTFLDENHGPALDHPTWYIRTIGLPQSAIDAIASFPYGGADDGLIDGGGGCAVCLSDFRDGEMVRLLPKCSHAFHLRCIDTWLGSHKNCPVCRAPVLATDAGNPRVGPVQSSPTSSTGSNRADPGRATRSAWRPVRVEGDSSAWETVDDDDHPSKNARTVRRSVSMDLSNSSVCRVMKRSFSFSGKRSMRKNTESIQLLEIDDLQNHGL